MPRPWRPPIAFASSIRLTASRKDIPLSATGWPSSKVMVTVSGLTATLSFQNATPMIGSTILIPLFRNSRSFASCEELEVLRLVRRAEQVGVGGVRLLRAHAVGEP